MMTHSIISQSLRLTSQSRLRWLCTLVLLWFGLCSLAQATTLEADADRTEMSINDSLQLTLNGQIDVDFSGFSLFNLNLPTPDLSPLDQDWDVVNQQQKYNFQSINGQNQATVTWLLTLVPKRVGNLTIPALTYKDATSSPISIKVSKDAAGNSSSAATGQHEPLYVEVEADKTQLYVQQQLQLTVRLYSEYDLLNGDLSEPQPANAVVHQVGKEKDVPRFLNGKRYRMIERQYVVFPQQSGDLNLDAITFNGNFVDSYGRRRFARAASDSLVVKVLPPPDSTQGKTWLPAMGMSLTEQWSREPQQLEVGDSVTRTITIKALGLEGSQIPPLPAAANAESVKQYPEQAQIDTEDNAAGVTGTRVERIAMVAVKAGVLELPEVRLPWYDTVNQDWKEAVLPARTIQVGGAGVAKTSHPTPKPLQTNAPTTQPSEPPAPAPAAAEAQDTSPVEAPVVASESGYWKWISLALLLIWLATLGIWWSRRGRQVAGAAAVAENATPTSEARAFEELEKTASLGWSQMRPALLTWARLYWPRRQIHSVADIVSAAQSSSLSDVLLKMEASRYGKTPEAGASPQAVLSELQALRHLSKPEAQRELPSLYPNAT